MVSGTNGTQTRHGDSIMRSSMPPKSTSSSSCHETLKTLAGVAGNVLEWYDFAVFGFFSDIIGEVFFPPDQPEDFSIIESFAIFGGAFLMRPVGGLVIGNLGDIRGRKYALETSIFLMAIATTLMGCLPTYSQLGKGAIVLLLIVRMLQGLSVGGQLMSSLVFTLEGRPEQRWGLYGSFVMAGANFGTLIGGLVATCLRSALSDEQMLAWGWRIPFLSGILISLCGIYLKFFCDDDETLPGNHGPDSSFTKSLESGYSDNNDNDIDDQRVEYGDDDNDEDDVIITEGSFSSKVKTAKHEQHSDGKIEDGNDDKLDEPPMTSQQQQQHSRAKTKKPHPLRLAFSRQNRRSLLASSMVPMLWSGGFYLSFVWMAIWMKDFVKIEDAFGVNSLSLLLLGVWFPIGGALSDVLGRKRVMTMGGVIFGGVGPVFLWTIAQYGPINKWIAFGAQNGMGISLACWGAPMCAWLVEEFDPEARLTSVSIGYNVAQAIAGGLSPFVATLLVEEVGNAAPGILLVILGMIALTGLRFVAPPRHSARHTVIGNNEDEYHVDDRTNIELRQMT